MPATSPPTAEEAWRAANEQLRRVLELKDAVIAVLKGLLVEERAARVAERRSVHMSTSPWSLSSRSGSLASACACWAAACSSAVKSRSAATQL
ncbi:hypothetical protein ACFLIM_46915 [Nonomuraea sp. M3C6]|uniref:Uncharacterized protein n=1 Tax=Nonomuraea marmarensis TaxID=3351344 RepID=A0ABW7ATG5_9ACTN